ncbi:sterol desaturase family protein [Sphingomonas sp. SFZ2018-12]|nr:sterol desaturase family protein [Sphingomonas sp. SFZ2018-12]
MMLLGFNGAAVWTVESGATRLWLLPLLLAAIATSFAVERLIPYEPLWNRDRGDSWRDVAYAVAYEASVYSSVALIPLLTLLAPFPGSWPSAWPLWGQLLFAVIVADLGITLCHYASHRVEWLWRFHAPHHSVTRMYGFNGLIKHPVHQLLETTAGTTPLILIGMPLEVGLLLGFAITIQLLLQHSNANMRIGPLRYVLALAPLHRFHHQKWAGVGDVNFGLFTNIWDHLLGTAVYEPEKRFTSADLGIGKRPDYPMSYLEQLAEPLRARPRRYGEGAEAME